MRSALTISSRGVTAMMKENDDTTASPSVQRTPGPGMTLASCLLEPAQGLVY